MTRSAKITFYTVGKLVLGGIGLLMLLTTAVSTLGFGLLSALSEGVESGGTFSLLALSWNAGVLCLLLIPMLVNVILGLLDKQPLSWRPRQSFKFATIALLLWPLLFWLGTMLAEQAALAWALLPPLQILLIIIPLWWLVETGMRFLNMPRTNTEWSVISVSLLVTPSVMIFVEILFVGLALAGFLVWAIGQPAVLASLEQFSLRIMNAPNDPEIVERILTPYLQNPGVISAVLVMAAGVIPLLEEIFKPLALWFLIPRKLSPREGFAMGMVSGAIFGLIESLGNLTTPLGELWPTVVFGRLGTCLLHTLTTALVGWGIASAWTHRRVLRSILIYLGAVALHAIWNAFALLMGFSPFLDPSTTVSASGLFSELGQFAPFVLGALAVFMLFFFMMRSRSLGWEDLNTPPVLAADE